MAFRSKDILGCYSASYDEARRAFLRAAEEQDAAVTSHRRIDQTIEFLNDL